MFYIINRRSRDVETFKALLLEDASPPMVLAHQTPNTLIHTL